MIIHSFIYLFIYYYHYDDEEYCKLPLLKRTGAIRRGGKKEERARERKITTRARARERALWVDGWERKRKIEKARDRARARVHVRERERDADAPPHSAIRGFVRRHLCVFEEALLPGRGEAVEEEVEHLRTRICIRLCIGEGAMYWIEEMRHVCEWGHLRAHEAACAYRWQIRCVRAERCSAKRVDGGREI